MKTLTLARWSAVLAAAALPLAGGCVRGTVDAAPTIVTNPETITPVSNAAPANLAEPAAAADLENAPAKVVSTPADVVPAANLSASAAEVARLSQSGVDEGVMLAYVNSAGSPFGLGSDQIIYLNDIGVPGNVVTAMIQRDQNLKTNVSIAVLPPPAPAPVVAPVVAQAEPPAPLPVTAEVAPAPPESNVSYTYFRESLSPYGSWIEVDGYGQCWQPSVVVVDRSWTPYCDRGRWVYSDCGWYWASDYSWGWAPFHYGRWFRHQRWGWCWAPDTVWGPSWVSWRYNSGYCGWAPLPPAACYRPGAGFTYHGRSVGADFAFGLTVNNFTFVAARHFTDPRPFQHRVPHHEVTQIFNNTVIINPVTESRGNPRFHRGIPPKQISEVTRTEIKEVKIRETSTLPPRGRVDTQDRDRGTLTVFRPPLPVPSRPGLRAGEGVKPATPALVIPRTDPGASMQRGVPRKSAPEPVSPPRVLPPRNNPVPVYQAPGENIPRREPNNDRNDRNDRKPSGQSDNFKPVNPPAPVAPVVHNPAPVFNPPRLNPPVVTPRPAPVQISPAPTFPRPSPGPALVIPAKPAPPVNRDHGLRSQPVMERSIPSTPTVPKVQPIPRQLPAPYVSAPAPQPRLVLPTPAPSRVIPAPQPAPRIEAPRPVAPPISVPRENPRSNGGGNSRDKGDNGNARNR